MKKFLSLFLTALLLLAPMTIFAVGATSNKDINEELLPVAKDHVPYTYHCGTVFYCYRVVVRHSD